ncbi:hypothetical protein [Microcoleus sp. CAWBG58]|uniref:hypothetical protein n=1 Tax=Microcoleus sp. CAWBG58 TaxID=2841651 RepID=UPI0025D6D9F4|nr:hypothetical protein [Microcoleus sp. CAWBG58]
MLQLKSPDLVARAFNLGSQLLKRIASGQTKVVEKPQELRIEELAEKYPKQWVTVEITKRDGYGFPLNGKVLLYANSIDLMVDKIKDFKGDLYTFYTGSIDNDTE